MVGARSGHACVARGTEPPNSPTVPFRCVLCYTEESRRARRRAGVVACTSGGVQGYPAKDTSCLSSAAMGGTTAHAYSTACAPQNDAVILKTLLALPAVSFAKSPRTDFLHRKERSGIGTGTPILPTLTFITVTDIVRLCS